MWISRPRLRIVSALAAVALAVGVVLFGHARVAARRRDTRPGVRAAAAPPAATSPAPRETFQAPELRFGDRWTIMVRSAVPDAPGAWQPDEAWQFTVTGVRDDQAVVEARPLGSRDEAPVTLLLDPHTGTMLRSRVVVPSNYGPKMIDERYDLGKPCVSELSPVPFDRPAFPLALPTKTRIPRWEDCTEVAYERTQTPRSGGVAFSGRTVQRVYRSDAKTGAKVMARGARSAGGASPLKSMPATPRCRVEIVGPRGETVEQLWAARIPWPVYSGSATKRCWLINFKRAATEG